MVRFLRRGLDPARVDGYAGRGTVVLTGSLPVERLALDLLVAEFGLSLKEPPGLRHWRRDATCRAASISIFRNQHLREVVREQPVAGSAVAARNVT